MLNFEIFSGFGKFNSFFISFSLNDEFLWMVESSNFPFEPSINNCKQNYWVSTYIIVAQSMMVLLYIHVYRL